MKNRLSVFKWVSVVLLLASCSFPELPQQLTSSPFFVQPTEESRFAVDTQKLPQPTAQSQQSVRLSTPTLNAQVMQDYLNPGIIHFNGRPVLSIDATAVSRDAVCSQPSEETMAEFVALAKQAYATHVAVSVPYASYISDDASTSYQSPKCGDVVWFIRNWVAAIHAGGLNVFFRQEPLQYNGLYEWKGQKDLDQSNHLTVIRRYILHNDDMYKMGDIVAPVANPDSAGIKGVNCKFECTFESAEEFNAWLRDALVVTRAALAEVGKPEIVVCCYGFSGLVVGGAGDVQQGNWGYRSDGTRGGILDDATIAALGNWVCLNNYFSPKIAADEVYAHVVSFYQTHLGQSVRLCITEWGPTAKESRAQIRSVLEQADAHNILFFNWWQAGPDGNGETLFELSSSGHVVLNDSGNYAELQDYFLRVRNKIK